MAVLKYSKIYWRHLKILIDELLLIINVLDINYRVLNFYFETSYQYLYKKFWKKMKTILKAFEKITEQSL